MFVGLSGSSFDQLLSHAYLACFLAHVVGNSIKNLVNECVRYGHILFSVHFRQAGKGGT